MTRLTRALALAGALLIAATGAPAFAQVPGTRTAPWPEEVVRIAEALPVQEGGRIKPLHTYANYMLLRMNGKRSVTTLDGERLGPVAWLLDVLFFPGAAEEYPAFLVQDAHVIEAIGLSAEGKKKRDRYSFQELRPAIQKLFELAGQYGAIEEKERTTVQQQVFQLAHGVNDFMQVLTHMDFARQRLPLGSGAELRQIFGGQSDASFVQVLESLPQVRDLQVRLAQDPQLAKELSAVSNLLHATSDLTSGTESLPLLPPTESEAALAAWHTPVDLMVQAFRGGSVAQVHLQMLAALSRAAQVRDDPVAFSTELRAFRDLTVPLAERRGEYEKVGLEVTYFRMNLLGHAQLIFALAFVLAALLWLRPRSRVLYHATSWAVIIPTALVTWAIVQRCVIRDRPPVSTLYETIIFVVATGSITALFAELFTRQRLALTGAAVMGLFGLMLASGYETLDKRDTMPQLVAVLDTNFWLATHVTTITVGYAAGLLAALLGNVYMIGRMLGWKRREPEFYAGLARMVYGVLCFSLIFSIVGTILGGIWANESWGRFWGWDPKENGALLIVIGQLATMHAVTGRLIGDHGLCVANAFVGTVIGFSWWGVNLLGVGLHSYGFTSGIHTALWTYYLIQWGLIALSGLHWYVQRVRTAAVEQALACGPDRVGGRSAPPGRA